MAPGNLRLAMTATRTASTLQGPFGVNENRLTAWPSERGTMRSKVITSILLAFGTAALALAQQPGGWGAAPTSSDFRLRVLEPKEGASIVGKEITIVLSQPDSQTGKPFKDAEAKGVMTPIYQIWIDGKDFGNLPSEQNVFTARDISYGPHKIVVAAKNAAGELVDRKEINVTTLAASGVGTATAETTAMNPPASRQPPPPPSRPAPETAPSQASLPASLPKTGTSYPAAAAAGLGLLVIGLALRRRRF
jgi:LPXTG-motif cell wall-anchored protein